MTPTVAELHFDRASLASLNALVGGTWRLATGEALTERPGHLFAWDEVFVATHDASVRIQTMLRTLDFEGYDEEYPRLSVDESTEGMDSAIRHGHVYFQSQGQGVEEVLVVRERITQVMNGEATWSFSTDYGVVFRLTSGLVAVAKAGHHSEALDVSYATSLEQLDIEDRSTEWDWDNEIGEEYQVVREILAVSRLLHSEP
jgi:hypothetical protein